MVATDGEPDLANLSAWRDALSRQAETLRHEISAKQTDLAQVEERFSLVTKLIEVERRSNNKELRGDAGVPAMEPSTETHFPSSATSSTDLEQAVEDILRAAGEPLHISHIRSALSDKQVPIPGRGDDANIIVRLSRLEDRFTRTARGTYGLAEWGIPALASKQRKRRRTSKR
jgi:hypothetical protein